MKNIFLLVIAALIMTSCQNDDSTDASFSMKATSADYTGYPPNTQTVSGDITANTVWTNDKVWIIEGVVRVKSGATLTIQEGTYIKAKPLAFGVATGVLVITKSGKINAQGTLTAPIIFTSYKLLDGNLATTAAPGDFGGVVILGDAQVNTGTTSNIAEGLSDQPNVSDFYFGGTDNTHNGGILSYVRIEFAGRTVDQYGGINGLSLFGVGSGTVINHVQSSYAKDDGIQFSGGTVNATHLVVLGAYDDNFDFELGYTGTITKAIAVADSGVLQSTIGLIPDSNGIEIDNNANMPTIITRPVLSQVSIIGVSSATVANQFKYGIHIRQSAKINLSNATVTGYNRGINWETPSLPSASTWSLLSIHGYVNPVTPVGTTLGLGSVVSNVNPGTKWGLTQPFINDGPLDFTGATGAFKTEALWTNTWTKFINF